jgi:DNA invertase Pin-like site-specific DNA recombinase
MQRITAMLSPQLLRPTMNRPILNSSVPFCNSNSRKVLRAKIRRPKRTKGSLSIKQSFLWIEDYIGPKIAVVYLRWSTLAQYLRNHMELEKWIRKELEDKGWKVIRIYKEIESGKLNELGNRVTLQAAIAFSEQNNAVLISTTLSRYIRSSKYSKENKTTKPTKEDIQRFNEARRAVQTLTILKPISNFNEEISFQTKMSIEADQSRKGGRPKSKKSRGKYKKKVRDDLQGRAIELRSKGMSFGKISIALDVSKSTIVDWVKNSRGKAKVSVK